MLIVFPETFTVEEILKEIALATAVVIALLIAVVTAMETRVLATFTV